MDVFGVFSDVTVGLIGAGIVGAFGVLVTRFRGLLVSRRFPIAGTFRSVFEDSEDGAIVRTKAIATIRQRGRRIWGPTSLLDGSRTWMLEGRIDSGGRIHGRYDADDPHDTGLGGFFLELHEDGRLEGMWTGYDTTNRLVSAGRYLFWPMERMKTRSIAARDLDPALSILGNALGARYVTREQLAEYISQTDKIGFVSVSKDGRILGAATSELPENSLNLLQAMPSDARERVAALIPELDFNKTGLLRSVAVAPHARGNGVATDLVRASVDSLTSMGATAIISIGWTDFEGCHIQGPLEAMGFNRGGISTTSGNKSPSPATTSARPVDSHARVWPASSSGRSSNKSK